MYGGGFVRGGFVRRGFCPCTIKAALFFKCFHEKTRIRVNIIRPGVNSILSIPIHCNSFYSVPVQFLSIQLFSIPNSISFNSISFKFHL